MCWILKLLMKIHTMACKHLHSCSINQVFLPSLTHTPTSPLTHFWRRIMKFSRSPESWMVLHFKFYSPTPRTEQDGPIWDLYSSFSSQSMFEGKIWLRTLGNGKWINQWCSSRTDRTSAVKMPADKPLHSLTISFIEFTLFTSHELRKRQLCQGSMDVLNMIFWPLSLSSDLCWSPPTNIEKVSFI